MAGWNFNCFGYYLFAFQLHTADVRVLHGKGVRFTPQSRLLVLRHQFGDAQRAGFDFVDEFHLQLGELVCTRRVTVRAEHDGVFRLLGFCVADVIELLSVFAGARLVLFHTAIIRGCAIALHFCRVIGYKVNCVVVHVLRDGLAVLVDFPGGVIQVRAGVFLQRDITAAPELVRKGDGFAVLQVKRAVAVHHRVGLIVLAGGILRTDRVHQAFFLYRAVVLDGILLGRKADAGAAACIRCCRRVQCGIMGRPVFDADLELEGGIREVGLQRVTNLGRIDLFFHLQLVMVREVERHRHVGLPHTALHVVHGKGVLGVRGEQHLVFALPVELIICLIKSYFFGVAIQRLII